MPGPPYEPRKDRTRAQRKCIGVIEELEERRELRAASNRPQPWITRKLAVGFVVGLAGYAVYVYVVRFCVPMIKTEEERKGGKATGVAFLVVFSLLFLMFCWTYAKAVFTSPGYARDYVPKSPAPVLHIQPPYHPSAWENHSQDSIAGTPSDHTTSPSRSRSRLSVDRELSSLPTPQPSSPSRSPQNANSRRSAITQQSTNTIMQVPRSGQRVAGTVASSRTAANPKEAARPPRRPPAAHLSGGSSSGLPPLLYSRRPPTHAVLLPEYRYCTRDGLVKPMRAHHCRACGTCVLKYDHHCPWIGQCVGAFNHKFFINFLLWSTIFTTFIFASLIALNARSSPVFKSAPLDPQQIVVIALSGIFTLFTMTLFVSHVHLILFNTSTVEHLSQQRMRERERRMLSQMTTIPCFSSVRHSPEVYGLPDNGGCCAFNPIVMRRQIKKQWNAEWGTISTEGNLWWLGSKRANWEATMGKGRLGWILPIGRSIGDGLTYPTNPRFDHDGRWRRRVEWPASLR